MFWSSGRIVPPADYSYRWEAHWWNYTNTVHNSLRQWTLFGPPRRRRLFWTGRRYTLRDTASHPGGCTSSLRRRVRRRTDSQFSMWSIRFRRSKLGTQIDTEENGMVARRATMDGLAPKIRTRKDTPSSSLSRSISYVRRTPWQQMDLRNSAEGIVPAAYVQWRKSMGGGIAGLPTELLRLQKPASPATAPRQGHPGTYCDVNFVCFAEKGDIN